MLPKFSVRKPMTVFVAVVLVIVLGFVSFNNMTTDLLPEINLPYVIVMTTYPGASPEEVEDEITRPMEQSMATLDGISSVSSTSGENYSLVMLEFAEGTDMDIVTGEIREKINLINGAWSDLVGTPTILKLNPSMLPVAVVAVDREQTDIMALSNFVNDSLMNEMEGIEGVASVSASGVIEQT
ncbi:MAG: efflux RND transporter permease subunit, partial [Clostridia bacterium]|nr:efflux RND transporter permease subunit [Clostridia bacterium]